MSYTDPAALAAITRAIEAEQAFVYAAGLAAANLTGRPKRQAIAELADHQGRLQVYSAMIDPAAVPIPPPAFAPPEPITDARSARANLAALNNALVGIDADVAASTADDDRAFAIDCAQSCARAAVQWGAASQAFPS